MIFTRNFKHKEYYKISHSGQNIQRIWIKFESEILRIMIVIHLKSCANRRDLHSFLQSQICQKFLVGRKHHGSRMTLTGLSICFIVLILAKSPIGIIFHARNIDFLTLGYIQYQ